MFNLNKIVSSEKQIEYFWNNLIELSRETNHSSRSLRLSFGHSHEVKSRRPHWGIWGHSQLQARCCFWSFHSKVNLQNADASHMHKRFWIQNVSSPRPVTNQGWSVHFIKRFIHSWWGDGFILFSSECNETRLEFQLDQNR